MVSFTKRVIVSITSRKQNVPVIITSLCTMIVMIYLKTGRFDDAFYGQAYRSPMDFENFDNVSGTPFGVKIVPNIVHLIRFGKKNMTFIEAVCALAALKNQKPKRLVVHTDHLEQGGKYWEVLRRHPSAQGVLEVKYLRQPKSIFGQKLNKLYEVLHAGDIARLQVLLAEGGIYLDGDEYVARRMDALRKFEMTLGWMNIKDGQAANQVIIAHKHARFLSEWYNSYREYNASLPFYNTADKPVAILRQKPHLIHRLTKLMGEYGNEPMSMVYLQRSNAWTKHYAIHLMINHLENLPNVAKGAEYPVIFNEQNILKYPVNIKDMALAVYPFPNQTLEPN